MRRSRLTLRTASVRLGVSDVRRLVELKTALQHAERHSEVDRQLADVRGHHVPFGAPVSDGQTIRWALAFALERFRSTASQCPPPSRITVAIAVRRPSRLDTFDII